MFLSVQTVLSCSTWPKKSRPKVPETDPTQIALTQLTDLLGAVSGQNFKDNLNTTHTDWPMVLPQADMTKGTTEVKQGGRETDVWHLLWGHLPPK